MGGVPRLVDVENGRNTIPTALYFPEKSSEVFYGRTAQQKYVDSETGGRFMRSMKRILGTPLMDSSTINGHLNQDLSLLNLDKSVVENIAEYAGILQHNAHAIAASFGFRGDASKKKVSVLSGGELLKATLAAVLGTEKQPDLLILDEPTNNLDIKSTLILEDALNQYSGAILIVSHDEAFIKGLQIDSEVIL